MAYDRRRIVIVSHRFCPATGNPEPAATFAKIIAAGHRQP